MYRLVHLASIKAIRGPSCKHKTYSGYIVFVIFCCLCKHYLINDSELSLEGNLSINWILHAVVDRQRGHEALGPQKL